MLHCPSCIVELKITERQGVEIDYCPECRGVWLDRGELDKTIDRTIETNVPQRYDVEERSWRGESDKRRSAPKGSAANPASKSCLTSTDALFAGPLTSHLI